MCQTRYTLDVVLRFHYYPVLVCEPDCEFVEEPVPGDDHGFIRVKAGHPADFEISAD